MSMLISDKRISKFNDLFCTAKVALHPVYKADFSVRFRSAFFAVRFHILRTCLGPLKIVGPLSLGKFVV
jgi:hypothetical protein